MASGGSSGELKGWRAAEERVASLYRAFGYEVRTDVREDGMAWDVVATRTVPGIGTLVVFVEVKDHPGKSTPIQEVRDFKSNGGNAVRDGACNKAVLVTTGSITRDSPKVVASDPELELLTFEELERQLFDPSAALSRWRREYAQTPTNAHYLDLSAALQDYDLIGEPNLPGVIPASELLGVALEHPHAAVVIFGDFGTGKTTTIERLLFSAAKRFSVDARSVIPLRMSLRDFARSPSSESFALEMIRRELDLTIPATTFWEMTANGRFVFLLDGFDEITVHADERRRAELLGELSTLLFSPSPALLTSRPSYFASPAEYQALLRRNQAPRTALGPDGDLAARSLEAFVAKQTSEYVGASSETIRPSQFVSYDLRPVSDGQINDYLEGFSDDFVERGTNAVEVRQFLDSIYDLSELIRTPILLNMAVGTIQSGLINPANKTLVNGPAGLYDAYARIKVDRDFGAVPARRDGLTIGQRLQFAEECALHMAKFDDLDLPPDQARSLLRRVLKASDRDEDHDLMTDARTCSFLTTSSDGHLRFIHRSYQEFFYARRAKESIEARDYRQLGRSSRWEYLYFLGAFGSTDNDFYNELLEISQQAEGVPDTAANNAAVALLAARPRARALRWTNRTVDDLRARDVRIADSSLRNVTFHRPSIEHLGLSNTDASLQLDGGRIGALELSSCDGSLDLAADVDEVSITDTKSITITQRNGSIRSLTARATRLSATTKVDPDNLTVQDVHGQIRMAAAGERTVRATPRTINATASHLSIEASDRGLTGTLTGSIAEIPIDTFDQLATDIIASTLIIRGRRPRSAALQTRGLRTSGPGRRRLDDVLAFLDPSNKIDSWWQASRSVIAIGGAVDSDQTPPAGLTVRRRAPAKEDAATAVKLCRVGPGQLVVEGYGEPFDAAVAQLRQITQGATLIKAQEPAWLTENVRALVESLGKAGDADELNASIHEHHQARVAAAAPPAATP